MKRKELPYVGDRMRQGGLVHEWATTHINGDWSGWCHASDTWAPWPHFRPLINDRANDEEGITCFVCLVSSR